MKKRSQIKEEYHTSTCLLIKAFKTISIIAACMVIFTGCSSHEMLIKKTNPRISKINFDTVYVLPTIPEKNYNKLFIGTKVDSSKNDSIPPHVLAKLQRKFKKIGVVALPVKLPINDTIKSYAENFFNLIYCAKDPNNVLIPDTIQAYLKSCPGQFFIITSVSGGTLSPSYQFRKNIKFILLEIATLRLVRFRICEGWSHFNLAIVDKSTSKAIYYGYSRRFITPYEEANTNKQIEQILYDFINGIFIKKE